MATVVHIGRRDVVQRLMDAVVVVILNEPSDFLVQLPRQNGHYSSRVRAMRRKAAENDEDYKEHPLVTVEPEPEAIREAKRRWANLLRQILEVEPLRCPRCGETTMRIVAFITEPKTIDKILEHLKRRTHTSRRRQRAPPRRWKSTATNAPA